MNVDRSVSTATSSSVLLPRFILLCVGAISRVKLWLLFTFAQQKHAYSSAKQNHSRCRYSDTHENNSIPTTAAPMWPKIGNVSESLSQCPEVITFMTFSWLCNYNRKCPHRFFRLGSLNGLSFHAQHRGGGGWRVGGHVWMVRTAQNNSFSSRLWARHLLHKPVSSIHSSPVADEPGEQEKKRSVFCLTSRLNHCGELWEGGQTSLRVNWAHLALNKAPHIASDCTLWKRSRWRWRGITRGYWQAGDALSLWNTQNMLKSGDLEKWIDESLVSDSKASVT